MMVRVIKRLSAVLVFVLAMTACEKETLQPYVFESDEPLSYTTEIQPIFDNNCVSCHGGAIAPDLTPEKSYTELIEGGYINTDTPETSEIYTKLLGGSHEPRASDVDKQKILIWIQEGANNN